MKKKAYLLGIILFMIGCAVQPFWTLRVFAAGWKIEDLQKEIKVRGYQWKAGRTSISDLSPEEFKSLLTYKLPKNIQMMNAEIRLPIPFALPTSWDWRNYNGENWITPVKNQHQCGSCYSFATLGTMETLIRLSQSNPNLSIDLAEQYLVSCGPNGSNEQGPYGGCYGNYTNFVCDFLLNTGVPDELCFPYVSTQQSGTEPPCSNACTDVASRVYKLSNYSFIAGASGYIPYPEYIKAVLVNKPVPCGMLCYQDFSYYTGGIYEPVPQPGEEGGGHLVYIIGYDDSQSCWIVKNSWGTDWGETANFTPYTPGAGDGGYFRISYVTSENTLTYFGADAVELNYSGGTVTTTITPSTTTTTPSTTTTISGNCPPDYPVDCGGGLCCPLDYPVCCNSIKVCCPQQYPVCCGDKYCYVNPKDCPCPVAQALGGDESKMEVLREMRDTRMRSRPVGQSLIELYYEHAEELLKILSGHTMLMMKTTEVINSLVEKALLLNHNQPVTIEQELSDSVIEIADEIEEDASPELKEAIKQVKYWLESGTIFKELGVSAVKKQ